MNGVSKGMYLSSVICVYPLKCPLFTRATLLKKNLNLSFMKNTSSSRDENMWLPSCCMLRFCLTLADKGLVHGIIPFHCSHQGSLIIERKIYKSHLSLNTAQILILYTFTSCGVCVNCDTLQKKLWWSLISAVDLMSHHESD